MDPLSIASAYSAIVSSIELVFIITRYGFDVRKHDRYTVSQSYGPLAGFLISTFFPSTACEYGRLQRVVLRGSDEEALRFRESITNECGMTAVAGAIIAQVALTALSLADLSLAHWTARAFLLFATVAGCLSVYYACDLSRNIGKLSQPDLIRGWLSADGAAEQLEPADKNERKASLSAIFILSAPYTMMSYSIIAFIVGLAIYQGSVWTRNLDTDAGKLNSRNVFIAYIVSSGFGFVFFSFAGVIKYGEDLLLRRRSFKTRPSGSAMYLQRDGEPSSKPEIHPLATSAEKVAAPPQNIHAASHSQGTANEIPPGGIAAALEAAAKAHIASAEADRQVAMEYARFSRV